MSYCQALEAAGAEVLEFKEFGSYQGNWWAKVTYGGETGWIEGSYGSCSGCDAFESEFGYGTDSCAEHRWVYDDKITSSCADCADEKQKFEARLADFGKVYLGTMFTHDEALTEAGRYADWDSEAEEMLAWITENK